MRFVIRVIVLGMVALVTSCYLTYTDLVKERGVTLEVRHADHVSMSAVSAYQEREHLLVAGAIGQKKATRPLSGWVQVTVVLHDGTVFDERCNKVWLPAASGPRSKTNPSSFFHITLPQVPPPGSVIRVTGSTQDSVCLSPQEGYGWHRWHGAALDGGHQEHCDEASEGGLARAHGSTEAPKLTEDMSVPTPCVLAGCMPPEASTVGQRGANCPCCLRTCAQFGTCAN